jgi:hypothetical protein
MTCTECKYQWCWLCEGKYEYGHYGDSGPCKGLQFKKINYLSELTKAEQERLKERKPVRLVRNNENLERYIGPDSDDLKTTLIGTKLYVINNRSNTNQNNNEQNTNNLIEVNYHAVFEIDDDLKVPFDDYFNDLHQVGSNTSVFPSWWHYIWGALTPGIYAYGLMYCELLYNTRKRWLRFIFNLIAFICSIIITMCYFCYAIIAGIIFHLLVCCLDGESPLKNVHKGIRVGLKDMKRIRRYSRFNMMNNRWYNYYSHHY